MPDEKPVTFNAAARARIARSVRRTESGDDPSGQRPGDSGDRWGKVKTAWASTTPNKITVNLCRQDGSETDTSRDWTVYITTPLAAKPDFCGLAVGDVIAFRTIYDIATTTVCGLWAGGNPDTGGGSGPFTYTRWFDVTANVAWTTLDTRNWTLRDLFIGGEYSAGTPASASGGDWGQDLTYWANPPSGNPWTAMTGGAGAAMCPAYDNTDVQPIFKYAGGGGTTLTVGIIGTGSSSGGVLKYKVEGYDATRVQVRFHAQAGQRLTAPG